jgi:hypothetical protein
MSTEPGQMALSGAKTAHARLELFAGASSLDLSADLVGERLHRRPRAVNWRMRLDQVERALKCEELLIRDATPRSAL